jgi:hypothetical protein
MNAKVDKTYTQSDNTDTEVKTTRPTRHYHHYNTDQEVLAEHHALSVVEAQAEVGETEEAGTWYACVYEYACVWKYACMCFCVRSYGANIKSRLQKYKSIENKFRFFFCSRATFGDAGGPNGTVLGCTRSRPATLARWGGQW